MHFLFRGFTRVTRHGPRPSALVQRLTAEGWVPPGEAPSAKAFQQAWQKFEDHVLARAADMKKHVILWQVPHACNSARHGAGGAMV